MGELRPLQHPRLENQNQERGTKEPEDCRPLSGLDSEPFPTVSANSSCGGRVLCQPREADRNSGQESGKVWAFAGGSGGCEELNTYEVGAHSL